MSERFMDVNNEHYDYLDEEELDSMRAVLAYILMKDTDMNGDDIYDLIFKDKGGRITWH